jgi:hypothetical protein
MQGLEHGGRFVFVSGVEIGQALKLALLFIVGRARDFDLPLARPAPNAPVAALLNHPGAVDSGWPNHPGECG